MAVRQYNQTYRHRWHMICLDIAKLYRDGLKGFFLIVLDTGAPSIECVDLESIVGRTSVLAACVSNRSLYPLPELLPPAQIALLQNAYTTLSS